MIASPMDFDALLERCGNFGLFQFIILLCFGATNILSSMHYYTQTMITFTPEHWCYHEKLANISFDEIRAIYAQTESPHCTLLDDVVDGKAIVAELNWVCDNSFQSAVGQSLYFMGSVIGTVFFGRLPAMICTTLTGALGDFLTNFVNSLAAFAFFRFVAGLSTDTLFYLMYIMVFEYLSPKKRTLGLNMITGLFYFTGLVFTPWFALWAGSWRPYLYIASAPALIAFAFPFLICESAQWLLTKQRYDVAKINKREVKDEVFDEFVAYC